MRKTSLIIALAAATTLYFGQPARAAVPPQDAPAPIPSNFDAAPAADESPELDAATRAELESLTAPLPEAKRIYTHTYRAGHITTRVDSPGAPASSSRPGLPDEKLIYSNTGGTKFLKFSPANARIGDDLWTNSVEGCDLSRYAVRVTGGVQHGVGEFSCKTSLWIGCPSVNSGGVKIAGTDAHFIGLDDDSTSLHDLVVDLSSMQVAIPTKVWVQVQCDLATAGWIVGSLPELGFTSNSFFFPTAGCGGIVEGPPIAFYAQIFAKDPVEVPCTTHFIDYASISGTYWWIAGGAGTLVADDFSAGYLGTGQTCILSAYDVAIIGGSNSPFTISVDLRHPFSLTPIPGTQMSYQGYGDSFVRFVRHIVPEEIQIPIDATMWIAWEADRSSTGLSNAPYSPFGSHDQQYHLLHEGSTTPLWLPINPSSFTAPYLVVYCRGEEPDGACCYHHGSTCLDDMPKTSCPSGRWMSEVACSADAFDPPCGTHGCCLPGDTCADLTKTECEGNSGIWYTGNFCSVMPDTCRHYSCLASSNYCEVSQPTPGCFGYCCNEVCDTDPYCCTVAWDDACLRINQEKCGCYYNPPGNLCFTSSSSAGLSTWVGANDEMFIDTCGAGTSASDAKYCCSSTPDAFGSGSVFFRFIATDTSARINTCGTIPGDAGDSLLQVYRVGDPTTDTTACNSLISMACSDNAADCGDGTMSDLCVTGLVPGETYYFTLASKTAADQGIYQLFLESPCPAAQLTGPCNDGSVEWLAPATGTVIDARQPLDPDDPTVPQGVTSLIVAAPLNANDSTCWTLCDTLGNPLDNEVLAVADNGDGSLTLHLQSPITPGAATAIAYANSSGCALTAGDFQSLPGDIDGQGSVLASTDGANFASLCLTGQPGTVMERCDIDRSGHLTAADLIRLLDLMNGAGPFDPWLDRSLSTAPCE